MLKKLKMLFEFSNGKGHKYYQSKESKKLFADGLLDLSKKSFWMAMASSIPHFVKPNISSGETIAFYFASFAFLTIGMILRHEGLKIIDDINTKKIKIIEG